MPDQYPGFPKRVCIQCQGCFARCEAERQHFVGDPWQTLVHECAACGCINMESEWNEIAAP